MSRRKLALAAMTAGVVVSLATQPYMSSVSSDPATLIVSLEAGDALPIDARITPNAAARASFHNLHLSVRLDGVNEATSSALLALFQLPKTWEGQLPDGAEPVDEMVVRGALGDEPATFGDTLMGPSADVVEQEVHFVLLVEEGEPAIEAEITIRAESWSGDRSDDGAQLGLELL